MMMVASVGKPWESGPHSHRTLHYNAAFPDNGLPPAKIVSLRYTKDDASSCLSVLKRKVTGRSH
jgi:hypothetical protein